MSPDTFAGLVIGFLAVIVIILAIRLFMASRQKELAEVQNRLMGEQVVAQNRTADIGEEAMREEEVVSVATPVTPYKQDPVQSR